MIIVKVTEAVEKESLWEEGAKMHLDLFIHGRFSCHASLDLSGIGR